MAIDCLCEFLKAIEVVTKIHTSSRKTIQKKLRWRCTNQCKKTTEIQTNIKFRDGGIRTMLRCIIYFLVIRLFRAYFLKLAAMVVCKCNAFFGLHAYQHSFKSKAYLIALKYDFCRTYPFLIIHTGIYVLLVSVRFIFLYLKRSSEGAYISSWTDLCAKMMF